MWSDFLSSIDLICSRRTNSVSHHRLPFMDMCSVASFFFDDVKQKKRQKSRERESANLHRCIYLLLSWAQQPNKHKLCIVLPAISMFPRLLCVSSSLTSGTSDVFYSVATLMLRYMRIVSLAFFFLSFQSSLPSSSNNAYTQRTLFHSHPLHLFSFSLFFSLAI